MWVDENNFNFGEFVKETLRRHLSVNAGWIGNPSDSTFGIMINLTWDSCAFASTVINFLDEKSNLNL